jgi:hypothetical protein
LDCISRLRVRRRADGESCHGLLVSFPERGRSRRWFNAIPGAWPVRLPVTDTSTRHRVVERPAGQCRCRSRSMRIAIPAGEMRRPSCGRRAWMHKTQALDRLRPSRGTPARSARRSHGRIGPPTRHPRLDRRTRTNSAAAWGRVRETTGSLTSPRAPTRQRAVSAVSRGCACVDCAEPRRTGSIRLSNSALAWKAVLAAWLPVPHPRYFSRAGSPLPRLHVGSEPLVAVPCTHPVRST